MASRLRVALDVTTAVTQRAGVGRYTAELARGLAALPDGPELRPFFVAPRADYALECGRPVTGVRRGIRGWRLEIAARHIARLPARGPWDGADLYHAPDVAFPPLARLPAVTTVHDLSFVVYPRYHTRLNGGYLRAVTPVMTRRARLVIADSEATRRDLIEYIGVPERKIRVVFPGIAGVFTREQGEEQVRGVRARYGLSGPFILSVGTLEPRKNLFGALRGYRLLCQRMGDAPPLALVGGAGWRLDEQRLVAAGGGDVRRLGYVPDEDLAALYAACGVFLYPSFHEGWGLPVAEAMSLGAPAITSNVSSLPEVAGGAALLVNPASPEEIAAALQRVLEEGQLAARMRDEGRRWARGLTARRTAEGVLGVYREALEG